MEALAGRLFYQPGHPLKTIAGASHYVIDSFPVAVCDHIRISRSKRLQGEQRSGQQGRMRRYFDGVKVQGLMTATQGRPVEFCFVPGSESKVQALKKLPMAVAPESSIDAASAYTDYQVEDAMKEAEGLPLMIQRKSNSKRKEEPWIRFLKEHRRKGMETTFSLLKGWCLRTIHAVTLKKLPAENLIVYCWIYLE